MMKRNFLSKLFQASLMCCLAVLITACDDMFATEDNPTPAYLSMSTSDVTLKVGESKTRTAIAVSSAVIEYTSDNTAIATVDANGTVTGVAEGETKINAIATGYSTSGKKIFETAKVSYKVIVKPAFVAATDIALDQTMKVIKLGGDALTITATTVPSDANYTWESDAAAIATVDETGKVTPVGVGIATITAKSGDVKATCKIFVGNEVALASSNYTVQNYDILKGNLLSGKSITIPDGVNVAFDGITTDQTVTCSGDATIYLTDGSTNTVNVSVNTQPGIKVGPTDKTLTIDAETAGDGILTAKSGKYAAGIGTGDSPSSAGGNITINGGTVNATGGNNAAGIGTGDAFYANNKCGAITINGGTVNATGGKSGAGIGTGDSQNNKSNTCGVITINGGTVNATGGMYGAGIGTGRAYADSGDATTECGNIIIAGGTVIATGGAYGAGIGTGLAHALSNTASQTGNDITIGTGVTSVIATKGSYAPYSIGVGGKAVSGGTENQACGTITIGGDATTYAAGVAASPFTYPTAP